MGSLWPKGFTVSLPKDMSFILLDGKMVAANAATFGADNWSLRFGQGLFETMLVKNDVLLLAGLHMARLQRGMDVLGWQLPPHTTFATLQHKVLETVTRNEMSALARVRLQVYSNRASLWDVRDRETTGYVIECFEVTDATTTWNENGLVVGLAEGIVRNCDSLSNLKTTGMLPWSVAATQARQAGWNDALVRNAQGGITESTIANVFVVKDGRIYTPPLTEGCVAGVMRQYLLARVPEIIEQRLTIDDLKAADEVFLTNAVRGIKWVGRFEDTVYSGYTSRKLWEKWVKDRA
jgi:branched-chain amino acid aminotransferase